MTYQAYLDGISAGVIKLSHTQKLQLAWELCCRLSPLYQTFQDKENWGNSSLLAHVRNAAENFLAGQTNQSLPAEAEIEKITPDTEDFGSTLGSHALDTAISHIYLSRLCTYDSPEALISILSICFDVLDRFEQQFTGISDAKFTNAEMKWQFTVLSKRTEDKDFTLSYVVESDEIIHAALKEYE